MPALETIPLSACKIAPENARRAAKAPIAPLAASIAAAGLVEPLQGYRVGRTVMVWDGGRRLRALKALARKKRLPPALAAGAPVILTEAAEAQKHSLVTFVREGLKPVEELRAYKALFDAGQDVDHIAGAMGADARRVAQILKLAALAPQVLARLEVGDFGLDTAQAFTLTDDHDRQRDVLAACGDWASAHRVRQMLRTGMTSPRERMARFVGRDAYLAAGGGVLVDLFADEAEGETWTDSALVERLAGENLVAIAAALRAEGWGFTAVIDAYDYSWSRGYQRLEGEPEPLSAEDQAAFDGAAAALADDDIDLEDRMEAEDTVATIEAGRARKPLTPEQRASATAFIQVDGGGQLHVYRGYVPAKVATDASPAAAAAADVALHGWGHTGHWHLTHIATATVRHGLLANPAAAYDVLVAQFAWRLAGGGTSAVKLEPRGVMLQAIPSEARIPGEAAWAEARRAWAERLPKASFEACLAFIVGLTPVEKAEIVSLGVGLALDAVELRHDRASDGRWEQLQAIARQAGVDPAKAWRPDESFLARGSKVALLGALEETGGRASYDRARKGELIAALMARVDSQGWRPKLLRFSQPDQISSD